MVNRSHVTIGLLSLAALVSLVIASLLVATKAVGQEVQQGTGLVCDTKEQVIQYARAYAGDVQKALAVVNANDPNACAIVTIAFIRGSEVAKMQDTLGTILIVEVMVVGAQLNGEWRKTRPTPQFIAERMGGRDAHARGTTLLAAHAGRPDAQSRLSGL